MIKFDQNHHFDKFNSSYRNLAQTLMNVFNIDEIHHKTKVPYFDEISQIFEISHMNEIRFLADEIHHLRVKPLKKLIITYTK